MKRRPQTKARHHSVTPALKLAQTNAPTLLDHSEGAPPVDWFKPWWKACSLFALHPLPQKYMPSARTGLEQAFEWFWEPNRIAAWAYELVRRLVKTKVPTESERKVLQEMPPYPQLNPRCRQAIKVSVGEIYGWGPALLNRAGIDIRPFKYSEPIPPWSFDLQCGEEAPLNIVRQWLKLQAKAAGIPTKTGKHGKKSRNKNQTGKLGDWDLVEELGRSLQMNSERRKRAIRHARKFKDRIIGAWQCCAAGQSFLCPVPPANEIPGFTGRQFRQGQFIAVFRVATNQFPVSHNPPAQTIGPRASE
jgi:hypothetical protein